MAPIAVPGVHPNSLNRAVTADRQRRPLAHGLIIAAHRHRFRPAQSPILGDTGQNGTVDPGTAQHLGIPGGDQAAAAIGDQTRVAIRQRGLDESVIRAAIIGDPNQGDQTPVSGSRRRVTISQLSGSVRSNPSRPS